jgi:zinc protease
VIPRLGASLLAGFLLLSAGAIADGAAAAPTRAKEFTLLNGLQVVVIPDHRAPVVTNLVWYRVGGADDPPGQSGTAHFFEHLMFRGTKTVANGEFSKTVARNGGQDNAETTEDYTVFFQRIAKDRLPLVMGLEADRMVNLDLSESNVATERDVVLEERHLRIDSDPAALAQEQIEAALHLSHPYGRPVIGWEKEIRGIGRAQAIDFYQRHYAPNNAVLMVVGDVTPDAVEKLAQEKFGGLSSRPLVPRVNEPPPPRLAETRIDFTLPGTRLPMLMRIYRVPGYVTAPKGGAESLEVLAALLGSGATSRLYKTLVVDKKLAVEAGADYSGYTRGPAEFTVYAIPRDGISFATLESAMDDVIAGVSANAPEASAFQSVKTRLIANYTYEHDNQFVLANDYGQALMIGLSIADVEDWPNRIRAVLPQDVRMAALSYLKRDQAVTGRIHAMSPR